MNTCKAIPHDTIVEIGAGEGPLLQELAGHKFGKELYALEISKSGVDVIRERCFEVIKEVQLFDGYSIPYDDNRFDLAILSHFLEHLEFPLLLIREAGRVARHVFIEVQLEDTVSAPKDFKFTSTGHQINGMERQRNELLRCFCALEELWFAFLRRPFCPNFHVRGVSTSSKKD